MATAMGGIILVERMKNKRSSFRGTLKRLKAYAAIVPKNMHKAVEPNPITVEFKNLSPYFEGSAIISPFS